MQPEDHEEVTRMLLSSNDSCAQLELDLTLNNWIFATSRYQTVIAIPDNSIGSAQASAGAHGAFWRTLSRDQFVARKIYSFAVVSSGPSDRLRVGLSGRE
jgi:hypothetical protein